MIVEYAYLKRIFAVAMLLLSTGACAEQAEVTAEGYIGVQSRFFFEPPLHQGQSDARFPTALIVSPKLRYRDESGKLQLVLNPKMVREIGTYDPRRNNVDIQEAKLTWRGDRWWVMAGAAIVYWGRLESRQIIDIINQRDLGLAMDPTDKLGQPMVNVGAQLGPGALDLYWLPIFREGTFPNVPARFCSNIPIDVDQTTYMPGAQSHGDFAIRFAGSQGPLDWGVSYFKGTGREPRMVLGKNRAGADVLIPYYDPIRQFSIDAQATLGATLTKMEWAWRWQNGEQYSISGIGLEHTFFNVQQSNIDLALITELLWDSRSVQAPPTTFDANVFLGLRVAANDINDTSMLAGVLIDRHTGSRSAILNAETRLFQKLKLNLQLQTYSYVHPSELVLYQIRKDSNVRLSLYYYF